MNITNTVLSASVPKSFKVQTDTPTVSTQQIGPIKVSTLERKTQKEPATLATVENPRLFDNKIPEPTTHISLKGG